MVCNAEEYCYQKIKKQLSKGIQQDNFRQCPISVNSGRML